MILSDNFICFLKENFKVWANDEAQSKLRQGTLTLDKNWCAAISRMAAYKDRLDILKELFSYTDGLGFNWQLDKQGFINIKDKQGNTAIFIAASMGHTAVFSYLLERKACIYRANEKFHTPLSIAYKKEHKGILESFFQSGTPLSYYSEYGYSILETALNNQEIEFAQFLVTNAKDLNIHQPLKCLEKSYWNINNVPFHTESLTPLVRAIKAGNFELALSLIKLGANVNISSAHGETPFRFLLEQVSKANNNAGSKTLSFLKLVLSQKHFVFIEPSDTAMNDEGVMETNFAVNDFMFALVTIVEEELRGKDTVFYEMLPVILSKCPDINAVQKCPEKNIRYGRKTPLELALQLGSLKIVNDLLANGANPYRLVDNRYDYDCVLDNIPYLWKEKLYEFYYADASAYQRYLEAQGYRHDPEERDPESQYEYDLGDTQRSFNLYLERFEQLIPTLTDATERLQDVLTETTSFPKPISNIVVTYAYWTHQKNWKQHLAEAKQNFANHRQELLENPGGHDVESYCPFPMVFQRYQLRSFSMLE